MKFLLENISSVYEFRKLCWSMAVREVQSRYAGTAAGIFWIYFPPLLTMGVYYFVFDLVFKMRLGENAPVKTVGVYMIAGMLPWLAFTDSVSRGMNSLIDAGNSLQKNPLPPVLFVTRTVFSNLLIFSPILIALWFFYLKIHGLSFISFLSFFILMCLQFLTCWLISYILAIFAAAIRDTVQIVSFILSIGVFVSPVLFQVSMFPENWRWILWLNPMTPFILGYQDSFLLGNFISFINLIGIFLWIFLLMIILNVSIKRTEEELVDWL